MMKWTRLMFVGAVFVGCGGSPPQPAEGPAEKAGKEIDDAAEKVKEKTKDAVDKAGDDAEDAGDEVEKKTDPKK